MSNEILFWCFEHQHKSKTDPCPECASKPPTPPLTDSQKLRALAEWFDTQYQHDDNSEVQQDLRRIADRLEGEQELDNAIAEMLFELRRLYGKYESEETKRIIDKYNN